MVADGLTGPAATDAMLARWAKTLDDPEDGPVFWLALAASQSRLGRLEDRVRKRAIDLIHTGQDLERWAGQDLTKRQVSLAKLEVELLSAQRRPVKVRAPFRSTTPLRRGDLATYRLTDGRLVLLRVVARVGDERNNHPVVELADWVGRRVPWFPSRIPVRQPLKDWVPDQIDLVQFQVGDYPAERVEIVKRGIAVKWQPNDRSVLIVWTKLDEYLREDFGIGEVGSRQ
jgi:hypothetical protein